MHISLHWMVVSASLLATGCHTTPPPTTIEGPPATIIPFDAATLTFKHPQTGHLFHLHLRDELYQDTGGITPMPSNVKVGHRDATSSYYEPEDENGGAFAPAESLYQRDLRDIVASNTSIQYQPDSGYLLITEDKSDGLPCKRYILYTTRPAGGYEVKYLSPEWHNESGHLGLPTSPPDIVLLPGGRAKINGKIILVRDIVQSSMPFSLGG